ncbi:hypothetical protein [Streptomyces cellostaticus]|uniref:hypothetical protein n=1 Tax=Streptomyces cellostaticus TaxID=67285 RepID=UPI000A638139|nr:hypothetical protein [Streptomyces cellostaticus]GHI05390.1 hypothetical protein Scel_37110 [Streptomyces cellostaticus]
MTPIRAQSRTAETDRQAGPAQAAEPALPAVRRGRHRKPRPRKVLLATGGLALAAGVLSLVRVAPEAGVGAPGTAEAEPRLDPGGGATDHAADPAATVADVPTPLPSAASVMGGVSAAPTATATTGPTARATPTALPGSTGVPTTIPTAVPQPTATSSAPAPRPSPTTTAPTQAPAPAPSHSTTAPAPGGGVCVPVIGLCVDLPGASRP